jgi:hypothetical protein
MIQNFILPWNFAYYNIITFSNEVIILILEKREKGVEREGKRGVTPEFVDRRKEILYPQI